MTENAHNPKKRQRSATPDTPRTHVRQLEPSIFNIAPLDEFTREVGTWLWNWIKDRPNVEIEAKIGILLDQRVPKGQPPMRFQFPVATEAIITDTAAVRFESNMTIKQHAHYNKLLNMRVEESANKAYKAAPVMYHHSREIDEFHKMPPGMGSSFRSKLRVTKDEKTGVLKEKGCVEKSRIADMNVFSPKRGFDFRISVSVENEVPLPTSQSEFSRKKDRISYKHQSFQVDLTQVYSKPGQPPLHELEVEFTDATQLAAEGLKEEQGQPNIYYDLVQIFLNNVRMLVRNACPP